MTDADLSKLARQHAETSRLLGVPWVPAYGGDAVAADAETSQPATADSDDPPPVVVTDRGKSVEPPASGEKASRMAELRARYEADAPHDAFVTNFNNIVWGDGSLDAKLMFVGEAPGADEDMQGIPFVGRAGQLLNKMIGAMGLSRETVYIANVLKTRPPNNATPTPDEAAACKPYLLEQISIIAPEVIVTLGKPASQTLLQSSEAMGKLRGRWHELHDEIAGRTIPVMPTYHPAYLLRAYTDENRAMVWSDLQQAMARLGLDAG
ncbi:MAG: uracil-DNA glycosylase [Planctomycetota bacterium]